MLEKIKTPSDIKTMSIKELNGLAVELREVIIQTVLRQGGHLASNLGAVELGIALEYVFDEPQDKLVFDVGHQAYVHKLLTGRLSEFARLREMEGISGFPRRSESEYDAFSVGHSATAISAALGMARANVLTGNASHVAAVVGDGAFTGGMCYEALNDVGQSRLPLIVILNDNEMSISKNVGALSAHLTQLRQSVVYDRTRLAFKKGLPSVPVIGVPLWKLFRKIHDLVKQLFLGEHFFEALGVRYLGPIDGHDIRKLISVLKKAKNTTEPVLIHVVTQKGKGYLPAEQQPDKFHGVSPQNEKKTGVNAGKTAAETLIALAKNDQRIAVLTAAMSKGTSMDEFQQAYPDRCYDVGIAEEHMLTCAAGMAAQGVKPYVSIYSTFLQRGCDQLIHDIGMDRLPVRLLIDRAGLVGQDGATHQGVYDVSLLRMVPDMIAAAPRDAESLKQMIRLSAETNRPFAVRYPKQVHETDAMPHACTVGKWQTLRDGEDAVILAYGDMVYTALAAAEKLAEHDVSCGVVDAMFIKPMDEDMLMRMQQRLIVTLEEASVSGGLGSAVNERLCQEGRHIVNIGVPDEYIGHGTISQQRILCGLDVDSVVKMVLGGILRSNE